MNKQIPCRCGAEMNRTIGEVTHFIFDKKITLTNVPHYFCENCDTTTYSSVEGNIVKLLREAYIDHQSIVEYR